MRTTKCEMAYRNGLARRKNSPFQFSEYKINECARRFNQYIDEINRIAAHRLKRGPRRDLRHCTTENAHIWLKKLPILIAEHMGRDIQPAIDGLVGDGVSTHEILSIKERHVERIEQLVNKCDSLHRLIRANIRYEYDNFAYGRSDLKALLDDALCIIEDILLEAQLPLKYVYLNA